MEYKGVEYSVVQLLEGSGWRWEVRFADGKNKSGVTARTGPWRPGFPVRGDSSKSSGGNQTG
jgi:hypothetical protein